MKRNFCFFTKLLMTLLLSTSLYSAEKYQLSYQQPVNTRFILSTSRETLQESDYLGNTQIRHTLDLFKYNCKTIDRSEKGNLLEIHYDEVQSKDLLCDSDSFTSFPELAEKQVKLFLSSRGTMSDFSGFESLPVISLPERGPINDEKYIIQLKVQLPVLPEHPVTIGDSWTHRDTFYENEESASFEIEAHYNYLLQRETEYNEKPCLEIGCHYTITVKGTGSMQGMPFKANLKGNGEQKILFDHLDRMLIKVEGQSEIKGAAEFDEDEFSIPMKNKFIESACIEMLP